MLLELLPCLHTTILPPHKRSDKQDGDAHHGIYGYIERTCSLNKRIWHLNKKHTIESNFSMASNDGCYLPLLIFFMITSTIVPSAIKSIATTSTTSAKQKPLTRVTIDA